MGLWQYPEQNSEKNCFVQKGDEITRLDGTFLGWRQPLSIFNFLLSPRFSVSSGAENTEKFHRSVPYSLGILMRHKSIRIAERRTM